MRSGFSVPRPACNRTREQRYSLPAPVTGGETYTRLPGKIKYAQKLKLNFGNLGLPTY
jgi:hypothetical protein